MISSKPKVSIIVPVYNVENYVGKCLDSLVKQSYDNIEIIVVNDGSIDGSSAIIAGFASEYPQKVFSFEKSNGGLSDARNYGIDIATGDYFGFVDSDDYVSPTMYEEMMSLAVKHSAEMVICNIQKVTGTGGVTQKLTQIPNMPEKIDLENHFSVFSDLSYFACNKLFNKNLFKNKRFKNGIHFEDIHLIPQLLLECKIIAQTQSFHYHYLERSDSISKSHTEKGLDILYAVEAVEQAFEKSRYAHQKEGLKGFQILEGIYTFLAYLAYVKEDHVFSEMSSKLDEYIKKRSINTKDILRYNRFNTNYLLSLPLKKKIYYLLYFAKQKKLIRKLV